MPMFEVTLGRKVWQTATVRVEAATADAAEIQVDQQLDTEGEDAFVWGDGDADGPAEIEDVRPADR